MARVVCSLVTLAVGVGLFVAAIDAHAADPAAAKAAAKELLEKGWAKTVAGRGVVADCDLKSPALDGDFRVALAHWLALMNQNQYDKALDSLIKFFECKPPPGSHLLGLRAKAWIEVVKKNYVGAMTAGDNLAQAVGSGPNTVGGTVPAAHADAIEFLGHLAGFLEGPAQKAADPNARKRFEAAVLEEFDEPRKKVFSDAKAETLSEYQKLVGEATEAKQDTKESAEAAKQQKLEKLSDESQRLSSDTSKVEDHQKQLREEFMARMTALEREDAPLRNQLTFQQNQWTIANNSFIQAKTAADNLQGQAKGEKDSARRRQIESDLQRAQNSILASQRQVELLNGQVRATQGQRMFIQKKADDLIAEAKLKGFQLDNQLEDLDREKLKNEYKQKKAEKSKAGPSTKALVRETEARAFTTYDTFPLEELRETLLKNVR